MGLFVFLVTLLMASVCSSLHVTEGEKAELHFPYPCMSSEVTLMHRQMAPIYSSAHPESTSSPNHLITNDNDTNNCSLHLTLTNVTRQDEGLYILTAYDDNDDEVNEAMMCLRVEPISSYNATADPCIGALASTGPPPSLNPSQNVSAPTTASPGLLTTMGVLPKGSEFSVLSIIIICIFGLYVLLLMCLALGMVITKGPEEIFYGRKRDPKAGVRMEEYVHPPGFQA